MELRQLRYFVKVCELRSMGRAAVELGVVTSALSQQISRLESELSTRLLRRHSTGVMPTDAGLAFLHQAQLTLRHADDAVRAAQQARLSGHVSVGLAPTTATVLGVPLMQAMQARYPEVRLHMVEALSGHLTTMLHARQLDLAVLFQTDTPRRWSVSPLLAEKLFVIASPTLTPRPTGKKVRLSQLAEVPLILPSGSHGLRATLMAAFARARVTPRIVAEVDGLALLMDAVRAGHGATIQPGAATARHDRDDLALTQIADAHVGRRNLLVSLSDDELSPAALAARVVVAETARTLVSEGRWAGASLLEN
ncbi:LysR family tcuABC transcriptional regulator [Variovorax boronicumulans]|uniref:LysR family tcuABC transcriptional regulator n=1 Tax=Variovorax boronicumulans TaxID=436515 RepID=A0AAW8DVJ4_9BURK|nr:LysR family transcriptional regulator [Variovorax boronicumulans]MDP9878300.1 LysR family tcuABC transcriptional regulator [Variovorax boronicumulans]MDP9915427.1 LysR family tcuABC transcriptional regulator [Variovorax boronicumulans]MDP9923696.1 LysR family tcuABC transcriptional regulator [Variovorax boronicumulans]PBI93155.1 HTH-type transcriptional regulator CynR [Variovorax boronicumulans]